MTLLERKKCYLFFLGRPLNIKIICLPLRVFLALKLVISDLLESGNIPNSGEQIYIITIFRASFGWKNFKFVDIYFAGPKKGRPTPGF